LNRGTTYEWHSHDVLGWVYYHCQMVDDAKKELHASIETNPEKTQNRYHLALLYRNQGDNDKARQTLIELFNETEERGPWRDKAEELMHELETPHTRSPSPSDTRRTSGDKAEATEQKQQEDNHTRNPLPPQTEGLSVKG
jgi:tetratricopeptide (TPR) repeat protein